MSDFKNMVGGLARSITKTSKDVFSTTKLSMKLANEESALRGIHYDMGLKVHEIYAYGGTLGKYFDEKYAEILAAEARINEIRTQINAAKGVKVCDKCGKNVDKEASFCPKCGGSSFSPYGGVRPKDTKEEMPEIISEAYEEAFVDQPEAEETAAGPVFKKCPLCGYEKNSESDKFCIACGRML